MSYVLLQTSYHGIDGGCTKEERKRGREEERKRGRVEEKRGLGIEYRLTKLRVEGW